MQNQPDKCQQRRKSSEKALVLLQGSCVSLLVPAEIAAFFFPSGHLGCPPCPSTLPTHSLCATGACSGFPFLATASCRGLGLVEQVSGPSHPRLDLNLLRSTWGLPCPLWGVSEPLPLAAQPMLGLAQLRQPGPCCPGGLVIAARSKALGPCWDMSVTSQVPSFGFIAILCALYPQTSAAQGLQAKAISWTSPGL